jgi:hypothetical protein
MNIGTNHLGCDFCEHTSKEEGRVIYQCDSCNADCCSDCSDNDPADSMRVLCSPDPSSGYRGCAPAS